MLFLNLLWVFVFVFVFCLFVCFGQSNVQDLAEGFKRVETNFSSFTVAEVRGHQVKKNPCVICST